MKAGQPRSNHATARTHGAGVTPLRRRGVSSRPDEVQRRDVSRKCGIIGIFKAQGLASFELYEGLLMLQHRGQDSAGMVTTDWSRFVEKKENGLVKDVFHNKKIMDNLPGNVGIGHVRYPTAGTSSALEAQPFFVNSPLGIFLIHNGNVTNTIDLRERLQGSKSFFNRCLRTDSDSEVLLNVWADGIHRAHQAYMDEANIDKSKRVELHKSVVTSIVFEAGKEMMKKVKGAYSCIALVKGVGLVGFRDPNGIRPLVLGKRTNMVNGVAKEEYIFASEDCAFGPIGFKRVRDVEAGEMIIINEEGELISSMCSDSTKLTPCIFEYIYLSRPDSILNGISVYKFQLELGRRLAKQVQDQNWDIDIVVPVPDGARPVAIEMGSQLGKPYREGLVKNRYVGRTFIMPEQHLREVSVRRKLNAMPAVFKDQRVLLVDDSIIRGTTMTQIVEMVRNAGAKEVYLASASPPVRHPNVYGVDMPSTKEFIASDQTIEEINDALGADGLVYQTLDDLYDTGFSMNSSIEKFDGACFDGCYVTGNINSEYLENLEMQGRGIARRSGKLVSSLGEESTAQFTI
jgi:amidophosphoribosyltransferase